jgi:hypothetical protein
MAAIRGQLFRDEIPSIWPEAFNKFQGLSYGDNFLKARVNFLKTRSPRQADADPFLVCLSDGPGESREYKQFKKLAKDVKYQEIMDPTIKKDTTAKDLVRNAWLDDKLVGPCGYEPGRMGDDSLERPLTATGLYRGLQENVWCRDLLAMSHHHER